MAKFNETMIDVNDAKLEKLDWQTFDIVCGFTKHTLWIAKQDELAYLIDSHDLYSKVHVFYAQGLTENCIKEICCDSLERSMFEHDHLIKTITA